MEKVGYWANVLFPQKISRANMVIWWRKKCNAMLLNYWGIRGPSSRYKKSG
jgi:hypothetical protein